MPLDQALDRVPGLAGALGMQQYRQQQQGQQLEQVSALQTLQDRFRQADEMQKVRDILGSGKPPEEIIPALAATGPTGGQYAQHYIQALQGAQNLALTKQLTGGGGGDLTKLNPDQIEQLGTRFAAMGHPGGTGLIQIADRRRKLLGDQQTFQTLVSKGEPGAGLFSTLTDSKYPQIAQQAKVLQTQLDQSDPRTVPPQHWMDMQNQLAARETAMMQAEAMQKQRQNFTVNLQQGSDESVDNVAKMISEGRMAPLQGFAMKTPWGQKVMSRVSQLNPQYSATRFPEIQKTVNAFSAGKEGQQVRSFNVGLAHLDTLGELSDALGNGDIKAVNKVSQAIAEQTGETAPTNFDAAKGIVGKEIVKAIVGAGGGVNERKEAEDMVSRASSPAQLKGVIETYKKLFGGQLSGLKRQYEAGTGFKDFEDKYLGDEGKAVATKYAPQAAAPAAPGAAKVDYSKMSNAELMRRRRELAGGK